MKQSVQIHDNCQITEEVVSDDQSGETYARLTVRNGASVLPGVSAKPGVAREVLNDAVKEAGIIEELIFIPYYFRANRGGRGQMRVGLRRC